MRGPSKLLRERKECDAEMRLRVFKAAFAILLGKVNEPTDSLDQFLSLAVRRSIVLRKRRRAAEYAEYRTANARL